VPDPALGFPPGTPDGVPKQISWHSALHGVAAIVSFLFLVAACIVFAVRFARLRQWGWSAFSVISGLVSFGLPEVPNPWGGVFLFTAAAVGFAWVLALALRLMRPDRD
jgi:O-antigen/teichoic acid export membrane protein